MGINQLTGRSRRAAVTLMAALVALLLAVPAAGAQEGGSACTDADAIAIGGLLTNPNVDPGGTSVISVTLATPLEAGQYQVTGVSWDDHMIKPAQTDQTNEQWFVRLLDDQGATVYQSGPMSDLPDADDFLTEVLDPAAVVTGTAVTLQAVHAAIGDTSINSIIPQCAVFDMVVQPVSIDLELTKTVAPASVTVGGNATFTISVINNGPDDATGVVVTDVLPTGLTWVSDTGAGAYAAPTWTIGDLVAGATATLDIVVTVDAVGDHTNVAEVTAAGEDDSDSTPGNNVPTEDDQDGATVTGTPVAAAGQSIGDFVWLDVNDDGVPDPGESGLGGVEVTLTGPGGVVTTTTDDSGAYLFSSLAPGSYEVVVGTDLQPLMVHLSTVGSYSVVLADQDFLEADFGFAPGPEVLATASLGDFVFMDTDKDGFADAGETGLAGVTIQAVNMDTGEILTAVSNASGVYGFVGLPAGTFEVSVLTGTVPNNLALTSPGVVSVSLADGANFVDADFGFAQALPATGIENGEFALAGLLLVLAGGYLLLSTRPGKLYLSRTRDRIRRLHTVS